MTDKAINLYQFDGPIVWDGFKQFVPISFFVLVFGAAFGLASKQAGLNDVMTMLMSILMFAGASQFAALELWGSEIPLFTLLITVMAINARHILMGASLYPWLRHVPRGKRYSAMLLATDGNWALSLLAFNRGKPGMGILVGGGLAMWLFWVVGAALGLYFGNVIEDPKVFGLDMAMGCFLLAMVVAGDRNPRIVFIWLVAGFTSLFAYRYLPDNTHVVLGALAGGLVGLWLPEKTNEH